MYAARSVKILVLFAALLTLSPGEGAGVAMARERTSTPGVIAFGDTREQIRSTPIEKRPNRPLHVYGNAVRRRSGRGTR